MPEVLVVGGGPGGCAAALAAAARGARVTLVERSGLGGTCVHSGCIPAAGFRRTAEAYLGAARSARFGVVGEVRELDWERVQAWVGSVVSEATSQVRASLMNAGVEIVSGSARFAGPGVIEVAGQTFSGLQIVIAAGARSAAESPELSSEAAMALPGPPPALTVVGGGRFAIEWADLFASLGSRVTVAAPGERVLPDHDADLASYLKVQLQEKGVDFPADGATALPPGLPVLRPDDRIPNSDDLGLELAGIRVGDLGEVVVDESCRTSAPGVFAVGDVTGPPWLSNRAGAMGAVAAMNALGETARLRSERIPRSVNTDPELAAVGLTEEEALATGRQVAVGYGELAGNLRAVTFGDVRGAFKLVVDSEFGEILGAHALGIGASEVIAQVVMAMELEADYRDLGRAHHLHPSLAEVVSAAVASCEPAMEVSAG